MLCYCACVCIFVHEIMMHAFVPYALATRTLRSCAVQCCAEHKEVQDPSPGPARLAAYCCCQVQGCMLSSADLMRQVGADATH